MLGVPVKSAAAVWVLVLTLIMTVSFHGVNLGLRRAAASETAPAASGGTVKILAFGDSLLSGYGLSSPDDSFPAQLQARLVQNGLAVQVLNAGVAGDTTADGLNRLEWTLKRLKPDSVILVLGGNDMLRGLDPALTRKNLQQMLDILKKHRLPVLLAGMRAFKNLGAGRDDAYQKMYPELAAAAGAGLYPFYLDAIIDEKTGEARRGGLIQDDGIHPDAAGVALIVQDMLPSVVKLIKKKKEN